MALHQEAEAERTLGAAKTLRMRRAATIALAHCHRLDAVSE
jgi:hypothetical protein